MADLEAIIDPFFEFESKNTMERMPHIFQKFYNGYSSTGDPSVPGISITRTPTPVRFLNLGDSVGMSKPQHIYKRLFNSIGYVGGFFAGAPSFAGGATGHTDVTDGTYWINGQWYTVPTGGSVTFQGASGNPLCDTIKLYYVTEPGAGTFKVQIDGVDEPSYTNVNADDVLGAQVITITKTLGAHNITVVGLTGTVNIIEAAHLRNDIFGIAVFNMCMGGLPLATAVQTPEIIRQVVFQDIAADACFMEFKDSSSFLAAFDSFMNHYSTITTETDFCFIGTTPESDPGADTANINNNTHMLEYAKDNNQIYFDGYSPLVSYSNMVALGWQGDGVHPHGGAQAFLASLLWKQLGLNSIVLSLEPNDLSIDKGTIKTTLDFFRSGATTKTGSVGALDNNDITLQSVRGIAVRNIAGTTISFIQSGGSIGTAFPSLRLTSAPLGTGGPAMIPSGNKLIIYDSTQGQSVRTQVKIGDPTTTDEALTLGYLQTGVVTFSNKTLVNPIIQYPISSVLTTNYTVLITDYTVLIDTTSGDITVTMPNTGLVVGQIFNIKKVSAVNNVIIDPTASTTIDGVSTLTLSTSWENAQLQWTGANYIRL